MFGEIVAETLKRGKLTLLEDWSRVQREGRFSLIYTALTSWGCWENHIR